MCIHTFENRVPSFSSQRPPLTARRLSTEREGGGVHIPGRQAAGPLPWNSTNRVVPNRVVSIGPVYPSKAPTRAGLSLPDYVFVCLCYGTCPVS